MEIHQSISLIIFFIILGGIMVYFAIRNIRDFYEFQKKDKLAFYDYQKRFISAKPAQAVIIGFQANGISRFGNGMVKVRLKLDVYDSGFRHYIIFAYWIVRWLDYGKLGSINNVPVRIDQNDPNLVYPDVSWAMFDITEEQLVDQKTK
jgi:hypothetical protein